MTTYKEVSLDSFRPEGIGLMKARLTYTTCKPKWGLIPIKTVHTDVLHYKTYVRGNDLSGDVVAPIKDFRTQKLEDEIPEELKKLIGKALITSTGVTRLGA